MKRSISDRATPPGVGPPAPGRRPRRAPGVPRLPRRSRAPSVSFKDGSSKDVTIDPKAWAASVHGSMGVGCTDCHTEHKEYPHPELRPAPRATTRSRTTPRASSATRSSSRSSSTAST